MSISTFTLKLPSELKEAFSRIADAQDRSGAQILREFMRSYVKQHAADLQQPLIPVEYTTAMKARRAGTRK